ncbi:helix-turn-helix domain-containing protein, partial [Streptomyces aureus]|uniref:helix-turn-helix domain-containing protein n=1 Tax=Streptomyces aureus TaxID=193461 RepID=UPI0031DD0456
MATAEPLSAALLSADIASPDTMSADAMSPHAVAPPDGCRTHTYDDAQAEAHSEGPAGAPPTLIGSVQRAMRLLEAVASHEEGAPAKQLAREAGLALPT